MTPPPASDARIRAAASDDKILELTSREAQAHFGLCDRSVSAARYMAQQTWTRERILAVQERVRIARCRRRVLSHEFYHPGLHRRILDGDSCARIGADYGISAQLVHMFGKEMAQYASALKRRANEVVAEIESSARASSASDEVNARRGNYTSSPAMKTAAKRAKALRAK